MSRRTHILIIGGGSTGSAIAYYLAKRGVSEVALVEKSRIAWGQTGLSTGVVRLHYSNEDVARLALVCYRVFDGFEKEVGGRAGFVKTGFAIGVSEADLPVLQENVRMQRRVGITTRLITPEELREIEPRLNTEGLAGAAYEPDSGFADPVVTAQSFATAARKLGVQTLEETAVVGMDVKAGRIDAVETTKGRISVDIVVNATGVWANKLASMVGEPLPLEVVKEEVAIYRRPKEFGGSHLVYGDFPHNFYMRPAGLFETYLGALAPDLRRRDIDPDAFGTPMYVDYETIERYSTGLVHRFPVMSQATSLGGWQGLYDITPDWHPILGKSERIENLYLAVGLSGHGFKLCPAFGMFMADLILRGRSDLVAPPVFDLARFREGRLVRGRYEYGVLA